jgi:flavin reductase (DIM6/NTAB) family NADH-FMN oxidoreductase RutF
MISCSHAEGRAGGKDTAKNIMETKGFVVSIISEPWINQANMACIDAPQDVSEWPLTGLTKEPCVST